MMLISKTQIISGIEVFLNSLLAKTYDNENNATSSHTVFKESGGCSQANWER